MSNATSPRVERILIATDGSQQAQWATQFGRQLAIQLGAKVLLLHVVVPAKASAQDLATEERLEEVRREFGMDLLGRTRRTFPPKLELYAAQRTGLPHEEIAAEAMGWRADLVVMGTHGQGRIARLVLGSTADAVIRQSPCPVITISQQPKIEEEQELELAGVVAGTQNLEMASAHIEHAAADEM